MKNKINYFFFNFLKLLILILFSFVNMNVVNAQWTECNNCSECVGRMIRRNTIWCFAIDGNKTYTGITGGVFLTTNNGDNWTPKNNGLIPVSGEIVINSLVINRNNIFAGSIGGGIYLSTDDGENWVKKNNGLTYDSVLLANIRALKIIDNDIFACASNGVYLSTDNGDNWILRNNGLNQIDTFNIVSSITNIGNKIFAGARYGVYMTVDNGENWLVKNNGIGNSEIWSLEANGNNIYVGPITGGLYQSTDNGDNWYIIGLKDSTIVETMIIMNNYIIVGGYGIYISTDNGNSWIAKNSGLPSLRVISMIINGEYIFAGVDNYGIYRAKLSDLGITDVKEQEQKNENIIYPNPASNEFRLKFHAPTETTVQLSVFDLLGNKVLSQALQSTEGTNEKNINCEKLPQGYYYVKINVNEVVETMTLVIIK